MKVSHQHVFDTTQSPPQQPPQPQQQKQQKQQWLVSFQSKTHVFSLNPLLSTDEVSEEIQSKLSFQTGWPVSRLMVDEASLVSNDTDDHDHGERYINVRVQSSLRGGKGGFGTLLRSSARQSGAKLTTDFGACRDLQGRRLRHVNDEIKLRKWREAQAAAKLKGKTGTGSGNMTQEETDAMFDTPSGLYNWHLMVPSWADISKKESRKIQRQFQRMQQEDDKIEQAKQEKRAQYERSVTMYVQKGADSSQLVQNNVMSAVKEGLQAQQEKKRKRQEKSMPQPLVDTTTATATDSFQTENDDRPNSLCALSGEVVVEETNKKGTSTTVLQIQSQSDFSTLALFLDKPVPSAVNATAAASPASKKKKGKAAGKAEVVASASVLYYEVRLVTGGLTQIGWVDMTSQDFHPNSEQGEGVGDDKGSFGYDGGRGLKFNNGVEEEYAKKSSSSSSLPLLWKAGDVVGCQYNLQTGEISYSLNGADLGVAFTIPTAGTILFPGISCNGGEILELYIRQEEMEHFPTSSNELTYVPVHELIASSVTDGGKTGDANSQFGNVDDDANKEDSMDDDKEEKEDAKDLVVAREPEIKKEPVKMEALDLKQYDSAEHLEKLGLDRLKGALMAIDVKCGGALKERAARLFSLKDVERKDYPTKVRAKNFKI